MDGILHFILLVTIYYVEMVIHIIRLILIMISVSLIELI